MPRDMRGRPGQALYVKASSKSQAKMPECRFGSACTRSDCIYRHSLPSSGYAATSDQLCVPHVMGYCSFGDKCRNRHTSDEKERNAFLMKAGRVPCRFGVECRTEVCIYAHPSGRLVDVDLEHKAFVPGKGLVQLVRQGEEDDDDAVEDFPPLPPPGPVLTFPKSEALLQREAQQQAASALPRAQQVGSLQVPREIWTKAYNRDPGVFTQCPNERERFLAVNQKSNIRGVIDVHFQTLEHAVSLVADLLARPPGGPQEGRWFPWEFYDPGEKTVWIVTGAGAHTEIKGRKLLFEAMKEYLEANKWSFRVGKDHETPGAFLVKLRG